MACVYSSCRTSAERDNATNVPTRVHSLDLDQSNTNETGREESINYDSGRRRLSITQTRIRILLVWSRYDQTGLRWIFFFSFTMMKENFLQSQRDKKQSVAGKWHLWMDEPTWRITNITGWNAHASCTSYIYIYIRLRHVYHSLSFQYASSTSLEADMLIFK